ncbi:MAG TPA: DUF4251 domain-containing protein [Puia sp.]|nr:DUF4251 domain-containing protein [Puia sp.]
MKKPVVLAMILCLVMFAATVYAQNPDRQEIENARIDALKKIIEEKHYVFSARSATPFSGSTKQLTYPYELRVKKDTVDADLPYYGRAYTADIASTQGGINFTTSNFEYNMKDDGKGGWDVIITPKQIRDVQKMILYISTAGYATLQVTSNTRQMITFNGQIHDLSSK